MDRQSGAWLVVTLAVLARATTATPAQPTGKAGDTSGGASGGAAGETIASRLLGEPVHIESLGLSIRPPAEAVVVRETVSGVPTVLLADSAVPESWRVRLQHLQAEDPQATAQVLAEEHLAQLRASGALSEVLENTSVALAGRTGWRLFVREAIQPPVIRGWIILPAGEGWFLIGAVLAQPDRFEPVRQLLDQSLATLELQDRQAVNDERAERMTAGATFIATLTPERLRSLTGIDQWFRIYRPGNPTKNPGPGAGGGEEDIGYTHLQVLEAGRQQVGENELREPSPGDDLGLFVRIQARLVADPARHRLSDSLATFWMAWDRSEEQWSIRTTLRQGEATATEVETGVRAGSPRQRLTVISEDSRTQRKDTLAWEVPSVYLSQPEHWLLAHLLPRDERVERHFSSYFYDGVRGELSQRHDAWSPAELGRWILTTSIADAGTRATALHDEGGRLIRHERPDGTIIEPIDLARLRRIWAGRGMP